ncbi:TrbG/VirB9 family P-type conjugative transfer protein [Burkholderia alba]|uniref:TrbG/VirB9 family P-type conjugative transfer protein n=1 Tax=Burkholderia alba TaxID=2683677 RepID=UPI002B0552B6|nr:TrbG/VirB9 family P-type conjugative transfer protein [Burkholderia alba]
MKTRSIDLIRRGAQRAALLGLLHATLVHAVVTPGPCSDDAHLRCAIYDRNDVVRVPYRPGNAAVLQLEPGESLQGIGMGDAKAWTVGQKGQAIFFKPKAASAQTNFLIVTDKRRYAIQLSPAGRDEAATWSLSFDYPDTRAAQASAARARQDRASALLQGQTVGTATPRNTNYDMRGDTILAPTAMWDDGRFTYFQFATNRDLPEFYRVMPDGAEAKVNPTMQGDVKVIQDTANFFVLRLGKSVLGIRNNAYTPDGPLNPTGTTVPGTVRLLKHETDQEAHGE